MNEYFQSASQGQGQPRPGQLGGTGQNEGREDRREPVVSKGAPHQPLRESAAAQSACCRGQAVPQEKHAASVGAVGAVRGARAVIVGSEVNRFAAGSAAVVDEFLVLLDGHDDLCFRGPRQKDARENSDG